MKFFKSGFTLIELSIYMGLTSVFLVIMVNMFLTTLNYQLEANASSSVDQDARFIISRLSHDIHRADQITFPEGAGDSSDSLVLTIGGQVYTYSLINQNLRLSYSGNVGYLNSYGSIVPVFTVTRTGSPPTAPAVRLNFSLQSTTVQQNQTPQIRNYQTSISTR